MKLFNTKNENLIEVSEKAFKLEKEIQSMTEKNLEKIFGYQFVKSEYALNGFRIDSLAYDNQTNSFVIIEYKRDKNFSVIDQGYAYLSLMLNNKADFILEYNECMDKNLKKNDVDWSQSRVLFVAPSYTVYQRESINFKDLPIELWEIKRFDNDTVMYSQIKSSKSTESIQTISSSDTIIQTVTKEVKIYTENEHLDGKPIEIIELYEALKNEILNVGDVTIKPNKQYIAFVGKRNIVDFVLQKGKIKVYINMKYSEIDDPKKIVRDVTNLGSWGNGECEVSIGSPEEVDYFLTLVKQSYRKNG
jgi:predicted transport protein